MATLPVKWELPVKFPVGTTVYDLNDIPGSDITLPPGSSWGGWGANGNKDFIVLGATNRVINRLRIFGGRRVAIIGGEWSCSTDQAIAAIGITDWVYVDGCRIHRTTPGDAFFMSSKVGDASVKCRIYIQNCYITNVNGQDVGVHGDVFQQMGNDSSQTNIIRSMHVYNTYAESGYQGWFFLHYGWKGYESVEMERCVIRAIPKSGGSSSQDGPKYLYYFRNSGSTLYPASVNECYLVEGGGRTIFSTPYLVTPYAESGTTYDIAIVPNNSSWEYVHWPNSTLHTGRIYRGYPTSWNMIQASQVGRGYTHHTSLYNVVTQPQHYTAVATITSPTSSATASLSHFVDVDGVRTTQVGDIRITEGSDRRVTEGFEGSASESISVLAVVTLEVTEQLIQNVGFRLTEEGDSRVTEGDATIGDAYRVLEKFHPGNADLEVTCDVVCNASDEVFSTVNMPCVMEVVKAEAFVTTTGAASNMLAELLVTAVEDFKEASLLAAIIAEANIVVLDTHFQRDGSNINCVMSVTASEHLLEKFSAAADTTSTVNMTVFDNLSFGEASHMQCSVGVSANSTHTLLASSAVSCTSAVNITTYYKSWCKYQGVWQEAITWVKHEGSWVNPIATYVKNDGIWIRVE